MVEWLKAWLFFLQTWVQFPEPTVLLIEDLVSSLPSMRDTWCTERHAGKIPVHVK